MSTTLGYPAAPAASGSALIAHPDAASGFPVALAGLPSGAVDNGNNATGTTGNVVATMAAVAGRTNYITGFDVTGTGATAAATVSVTVAGVTTSRVYKWTVPAGATLAAPNLQVTFPNPIPASAPNTAITVTSGGIGSGGTAVAVNAYGYYA